MRVGYFQQFLLLRVTDLQQSWRFLILFLRNFVLKLSYRGLFGCFWHFAGLLQSSRTPVSSRPTCVHFSKFACSVVESFPILRAIFLAFKTLARLLVIFLAGSLWCLSAAFCFWCCDKLGLENFWFYNLFRF